MRIGFCVSGAGRVVEAILDANAAGLIDIEGSVVLADRPSPVLRSASRRGLLTILVDWTTRNGPKAAFLRELERAISGLDVDGLLLTFNWLLGQTVIDRFAGNVINLHMSALPAFPGLGATQRTVNSQALFAGITYHFVDNGMDTGPTIAQALVGISPDATADNVGLLQFHLAVTCGVQVVRWWSRDHIQHPEQGELRARVHGARYRCDSQFVPSIDLDIFEFSAGYDPVKSGVHMAP